MEKLIVTVTTDASMSYPRNPYNPQTVEEHAKEYIRCVEAGASIAHLHGPFTPDKDYQPDGTKLADLDLPGWQKLKDLIQEKCDPIIQYGIANGRFPQRVELMKQKPDMMSICFTAHDETFQPDPDYEPIEMYALHTRDELEKYCKMTKKYDIKPEVESFHTGAIWNAQRMIERGLLETPVWTTFFLGWPGGMWIPPTSKALMYMHDHKPSNFNYSVSVMDPKTHWQILTQSILLGGHVRVGMEDSPYLDDKGTPAKSNADLVEKIVRIAHQLGREIAKPSEARKIIGLEK